MAIKRGGSIVQYFFKLYKRVTLFRIVCLLTCFTMTLVAPAQVYVDTTVSEDLEEPMEEAQEVPNYFLPKGISGTGMDTIQLRHIPDSIISALKASKDFQYGQKKSNAITEKGNDSPSSNTATTQKKPEPISRQTWFQTLLWVVIFGGFITFLIIWLFGSNISLFRSKNKRFESGENLEFEEDIFNLNYQKEIDKAAAAGDYRLAVRLMFLRLLKKMSERSVIRYKQDYTNLDYLSQLSTTRLYDDFFRITRSYEYSWYGHFEVTEETYKIIRGDFDNFDLKIG